MGTVLKGAIQAVSGTALNTAPGIFSWKDLLLDQSNKQMTGISHWDKTNNGHYLQIENIIEPTLTPLVMKPKYHWIGRQ